MPAGFQSFIQGTLDVQLDNTQVYYHMVAKGTIPSASWSEPTLPQGRQHIYNYKVLSSSPWLPYYIAANNPILAFHTPAGNAHLTSQVRRADNEAVAAGVEWFLFDTSTPASGSSGFELYIPSVRRVFSSQMKPIRVLGVMSDASDPRWSPPANLGSKKLAAAVICGFTTKSVYGDWYDWGWQRDWSEVVSVYNASYGAPTQANSYMSWNDSRNEVYPFIDLAVDSGVSQIMVIDVTGY